MSDALAAMEPDPEIRALALAFTRSLCARDYEAAAAMVHSAEAVPAAADLKETFERVVPLDWGETEPLTPLQATALGDLLDGEIIIYVNIPGDVYAEGVTLRIANGEDGPEIRSAEIGAP